MDRHLDRFGLLYQERDLLFVRMLCVLHQMFEMGNEK